MFNSYEELQAAVAKRRQDTLTLEVDMGSEYSQEYEDAKKELQQAKAMKTVIGGQGFLGDNIEALEQRVAETKPESNSVWVRYSRLDLGEWALLVKQANLSPVEQYEKVLPKTFVGVWGQDPTEDEDGKAPGPLSEDASLLSSRSPNGILPGGALHQVVQAFMAWQNSGGEVTIRPTRSGRV
jgi:hypothetical protein